MPTRGTSFITGTAQQIASGFQIPEAGQVLAGIEASLRGLRVSLDPNPLQRTKRNLERAFDDLTKQFQELAKHRAFKEISQVLQNTLDDLSRVRRSITLSRFLPGRRRRLEEARYELEGIIRHLPREFAQRGYRIPPRLQRAFNNLSQSIDSLEETIKRGGGAGGLSAFGMGGLGVLGALTGFYIGAFFKTLAMREEAVRMRGLGGIEFERWRGMYQGFLQAGTQYGYSITDSMKQLTTIIQSLNTWSAELLETFQASNRAYGISVETLSQLFTPLRGIGRVGGEVRAEPVVRNIRALINLSAGWYNNQGAMMSRLLKTVSSVYSEFQNYAGINLKTSAEGITIWTRLLSKTGEIPEEMAGRLVSKIGMGIAQPQTKGLELYFLRLLGWRGGLQEYVERRIMMEQPFERQRALGGRSPVEIIMRNLSEVVRTAGTGQAILMIRSIFGTTWTTAQKIVELLQSGQMPKALQELHRKWDEAQKQEKAKAQAFQNMADFSPNQVMKAIENIVINTGYSANLLEGLTKIIAKRFGGEEEIRKITEKREATEMMGKIKAKPEEYPLLTTYSRNIIAKMEQQKYPGDIVQEAVWQTRDLIKQTGAINVRVYTQKTDTGTYFHIIGVNENNEPVFSESYPEVEIHKKYKKITEARR